MSRAQRFLAEEDEIYTTKQQLTAWKKNSPACLRSDYDIMPDLVDELVWLGFARSLCEEYDDVYSTALRIYTEERPYVDLQFTPKSSMSGEYPMYRQMNTALREFRTGGKLIGSMCAAMCRKIRMLYEENGSEPPCLTVYYRTSHEERVVPGKKIFFKSFRSTSRSPYNLESFGSYTYELQLDSNVVCAAVDDYSDHNEQEVVIAPGQWVSIWPYTE
eukprot:TRINITY_DN111_c0_g6_i1.p1 TRINITY_DN111_c0_g6~~TRINITY_DN111_c0_g6_i1.p1  ORF type:complete len:217 (+),score=31.07 TRINITY_DN111_c0_g6_i1:45-695(+)